jgi:arylsulfatase A-like enzyme
MWRPLRFFAICVLIVCLGCSSSDTNVNQHVAKHPGSPGKAEANLAALSPPKPNIILISLDTVRADHLGCYGYHKPTTPNLDRLAKSGIRFDECRTQATWTLPAHMSLFTSLLPSHHGVDNLNKVLSRRVLTLAEVLQQSGYHTAALVNNGQMRAHWGFDRGFDHWQEFEVDTLEGKAKHITGEAFAWLKNTPQDKPQFLFLHYYDAHDPYEASLEVRQKFGVELTGEQCRELCFAHRSPEQAPPSKQVLAKLQAAYDAGLAELDYEVGRLLDTIAPETLVVVFSDHGEAFREHGWLLHGATPYEEEVRVPLIVRLPNSKKAATVVTDSTMLLDVAPTILSLAGIPLPQQFQGIDLRPTMLGEKLPPRFVLAESKAVLEGEYTRSAVLYPYKAVWSLADERFQVFKLPDEQSAVEGDQKELAGILKKRLADWFDQESFWLLHARHEEPLEVTITLSSGSFGLFIPLGFNPETDSIELSTNANELTWQVSGKSESVHKRLLLEPTDPQASVRLFVKSQSEPVPKLVWLGPAGKDSTPGKTATSLPVELPPTFAALPPHQALDYPFSQSGLQVLRVESTSIMLRSSQVAPLNAETIRQLRSLGYLK